MFHTQTFDLLLLSTFALSSYCSCCGYTGSYTGSTGVTPWTWPTLRCCLSVCLSHPTNLVRALTKLFRVAEFRLRGVNGWVGLSLRATFVTSFVSLHSFCIVVVFFSPHHFVFFLSSVCIFNLSLWIFFLAFSRLDKAPENES